MEKPSGVGTDRKVRTIQGIKGRQYDNCMMTSFGNLTKL